MSEEKVKPLNDVIEMDETYVGGKPRKPNIKKPLTKEGKEYLVQRTQEVKALGYDLTALKGNTAKVDLDTKRGRGSQKLIPVTGIVQRDGAVVAEVMDSLNLVARGVTAKPEPIELSEAYLKNAGRVAQVRAIEASRRLAETWRMAIK